MTEVKEITNEIIEKLTPTTIYDSIIKDTLKNIKEEIKKNKILAEPTIGGSYAKNTHIGDSFDCDIFIRFESIENYKKNLKTILTPIAKKLNSTLDLVHGSRDYFQIKFENLTLEIIPVQKIKHPEEANHIMDYSPFHVTWVKEQLSKKPLQDDIRLMKQFLKANNLYGAESYVSGFSGHVNDILILYYGGFEKALNAISKWKTNDKTIIDYSNFYKKMDVTFFMNESKTQSPLIAVDPIDKNRNAAAALGKDCYKKLIKVAKEFLKKPNKSFFEKEEISKETLQKKHKNNFIVEINVTAKDGKTDVVGAKLVKALEYYDRRLTEEGFIIIDTEWKWDKEKDATFYLITKQQEIPENFLRKGPNVSMKEAIISFKTKNKNAEFIEEDGSLYVKLKRLFTNINEAIKAISQEKFLKEKIQDSTLLP